MKKAEKIIVVAIAVLTVSKKIFDIVKIIKN